MEVQETLYEETLNLLPNPDDQITKEVFTELKYVRACLKEALRFEPNGVASLRPREVLFGSWF